MIQPFEIVLLKRPFDVEQISFKPGHGNAKKKVAFAHADMRAYFDRLDSIFPGEWQSSTTFLPMEHESYVMSRRGKEEKVVVPSRVICETSLTIRGVSRSDLGEASVLMGTNINENAATTAKAQSFKRAAASFGMGAYLYELGDIWGDYEGFSFTDASISKMQKNLQTPEYRFWKSLEEKNPSILAEAAKLIAEGKSLVEVYETFK